MSTDKSSHEYSRSISSYKSNVYTNGNQTPNLMPPVPLATPPHSSSITANSLALQSSFFHNLFLPQINPFLYSAMNNRYFENLPIQNSLQSNNIIQTPQFTSVYQTPPSPYNLLPFLIQNQANNGSTISNSDNYNFLPCQFNNNNNNNNNNNINNNNDNNDNKHIRNMHKRFNEKHNRNHIKINNNSKEFYDANNDPCSNLSLDEVFEAREKASAICLKAEELFNLSISCSYDTALALTYCCSATTRLSSVIDEPPPGWDAEIIRIIKCTRKKYSERWRDLYRQYIVEKTSAQRSSPIPDDAGKKRKVQLSQNIQISTETAIIKNPRKSDNKFLKPILKKSNKKLANKPDKLDLNDINIASNSPSINGSTESLHNIDTFTLNNDSIIYYPPSISSNNSSLCSSPDTISSPSANTHSKPYYIPPNDQYFSTIPTNNDNNINGATSSLFNPLQKHPIFSLESISNNATNTTYTNITTATTTTTTNNNNTTTTTTNNNNNDNNDNNNNKNNNDDNNNNNINNNTKNDNSNNNKQEEKENTPPRLFSNYRSVTTYSGIEVHDASYNTNYLSDTMCHKIIPLKRSTSSSAPPPRRFSPDKEDSRNDPPVRRHYKICTDV